MALLNASMLLGRMVQLGRAELPEGEAAIGDEEVRLVEFPELDAETVVLDQEGITRDVIAIQ